MKIAKIIGICLFSSVLLYSLPITTFAAINTNDSQDDVTITSRVITESEIPEGITPVQYNSEEEAMNDFKEAVNALQSSSETANTLQTSSESVELTSLDFSSLAGITTLSTTVSKTTDDILVAYKSFGTGSINLRAAFGTSGVSHTGIVTYVSPYTTFTGFTLGYGWTETTCDYSLLNTKDAYIYTTGTLDYYLLLDNIIKLYSSPVNLNATCYLAR